MTDAVLGMDPGEVTGWSLWALDDDMPLQRLEYGLIHGGDEGFLAWAETHLGVMGISTVICEWFNPQLGYGGGGAKNYTAHAIQNQLKAICRALGIEIIWRPSSAKVLCRDQVLKDHGLWIMPKQAKVDPAIMHMDARDVHDSEIHVLGWAKECGHEPTLALYWPDRSV